MKSGGAMDYGVNTLKIAGTREDIPHIHPVEFYFFAEVLPKIKIAFIHADDTGSLAEEFLDEVGPEKTGRPGY